MVHVSVLLSCQGNLEYLFVFNFILCSQFTVVVIYADISVSKMTLVLIYTSESEGK
jgi:hypothetical protein